jgi:hypothetical protein
MWKYRAHRILVRIVTRHTKKGPEYFLQALLKPNDEYRVDIYQPGPK